MDHKQIIIKDVFSSLRQSNVIYELAGPSAYFGYDLNGSAFFLDKALQTRTEGPSRDCLRVIRAIFHCFNIDTVNPRSIWLKCKFDQSSKLIQTVGIGSTGVPLTRKKCFDFLNEIGDIHYGHFHVVKNPAVFSYLSKDLSLELEEIENLCSDEGLTLGEIEGNLKKILFQKLESVILSNGISKIDEWNVERCKSFLIPTEKGNLRIFRRVRDGGV